MGSDRQSNTVRCGHLPMSFTRESQGYALSQRRLGSTSSQLESRFHYVHSIPIVSLAIPRAVILATFCTITHIQYLTIRHLILAETTRSRLTCFFQPPKGHTFFSVCLCLSLAGLELGMSSHVWEVQINYSRTPRVRSDRLVRIVREWPWM